MLYVALKALEHIKFVIFHKEDHLFNLTKERNANLWILFYLIIFYAIL